MDRLPGEEGRREAKKPLPLVEDLLFKVGDQGVVEVAVGLGATVLTEARRAVRGSRAGSDRCDMGCAPSGGEGEGCEFATREGSIGAPVKVMVGLVPAEERFGG